MTAKGFGTSPIGSTPFGFGTPALAVEPPSRYVLAPFIDPRTKDAVFGGDGELESMSVNSHRVLITCMTERGSSTVMRDFGVKLPDIITESFERDCDAEIRRALAYMTTTGDITINSVTTDPTDVTGRVVVTVDFTDHEDGLDRQVRFNG